MALAISCLAASSSPIAASSFPRGLQLASHPPDMRQSIYGWVASCVSGAALIVGPHILHAQNTRDQQREAPEIRKLTISGVKHVDLNELEKAIATRASKCRSMLLMPFCWV